MFESNAQRGRACWLLAGVMPRVQELFALNGPRPEAFSRRVRSQLSSGEVAWLQVCLAIWSPSMNQANLGRLVEVAEPGAINALGLFLAAYGSGSIAAWMAAYEPAAEVVIEVMS